jgi:glycosyltransferase involved in cell wall biosynthesis
MRVLTVINSLTLAGAERLVHDLTPRLRDRAVETTVMLLRSVQSPLEQGLRASGVAFVPVSRGSIYSPRHVLRLARVARGFDLVHVHLFPAQLWMALASLRLPEVPLVVTEHGPTNLHRKLWFRGIDRWSYSRYRRIICNSEATAAGLRDWAPGTASRIVIIPNGVDLRRWGGATRSPATGRLQLTFTARLEPHKHHAMVLRALAQMPDAELRLVGDGPLRPQLQSLAHELGVSDRVSFLGHRDDVPELLRATDVYVHCAHLEGFGLAALEAMASGVPVVATRNPGMADVVGDAGLLVDPGDVKGLVAALEQLRASPAERQRLGAAGQERAQRFSIEATADAHLRLYKELLGQS